MLAIKRWLRHIVVEDDGATAIEYAVLLSLIVVVALVGITQLANSTRESFDTTGAAILDAMDRAN